MTAVEKLAEERDELKNARIERILLSAFSLFSHNGIDAIAMTDIAKNAEIGVASLYRYFATKDEIAIRTAMWAWESQKKMVIPILKAADYENLNGYGQLAQILKLFFESIIILELSIILLSLNRWILNLINFIFF